MKRITVISAAIILSCAAAFAQKGNIGFLYPAGAQRGTSFELTVGGQNLSKATGLVFSGEGISSELIPMPKAAKKKKRKKKNIGEEDNLQLADVVKFKVTIAADAALGIRDARLLLPNGMTNRLYFEVGELPDVRESPKAALSAEAASLPVSFNGQVMRSDVDRFRFPARKGQQLVIQTKARVLVPYIADAVPGWFQPIIRLYGPDGREVAYNDDYTFHVDPVIFFKVPSNGNYEIEINDALYRGREDFVYRIDVGELPFITSISPLGGPAGKKVTLHLGGYNLKSSKLVFKPKGSGMKEVRAFSRSGLRSNAMYYDATDQTQLNTKKLSPNTSMNRSWPIQFGDCVENVISAPMQQHWYEFQVEKKKQPVHMEVVSRRLGTPTDVRITLFDSSGSIVKDNDDSEDTGDCMTTHFADPQITMPLTQGQYYIRVVESQGHSGPEYGYRLYLDKASPDFALHLEPSTFSVPEGGTGLFNVNVVRKQNFRGEVALEVKGLPKGSKVSGNIVRQGMNKAIVTVSVPKGTAQETVHPEVVGTAESKGETITRTGVPVEVMMQAFYYNHLMPMDEFRMEVGKELPFRLRVEASSLKIRPGEEVPVKVYVDRNPGFTSPVTLMLKSNMPRVKAEAVLVPGDASEATVYLTLRDVKKPKKAKTQTATLVVSGVVKGSSKKIAGKARNAFVAAMTAYAPAIYCEVRRD